MGGCCCASRRKTEPNVVPTYYYFPQVPEEQVPLSSHHAGASGVSAGFLVNPDLETSNPDAPAPDPNVVDSGTLSAESGTRETPNTKTGTPVQLTSGDSVRDPNAASSDGGTNAADSPPGSLDKDLKDIVEKDPDFEKTTSIDIETEPKKSSKTIAYVVEECPTCLEEYDEENPKIITTCRHDFHLPCILEWMERSDTCPVCNKVMGIDESIVS